MKRTLFYWLPPLLWMTLIFILSSQQRVSVSDITSVNFIFFKSLHIIEYAILFMLLFRALYKERKLPSHKALLYAMIIAIIYGVSDELHQMFVPTREGSPRDIVIDTIGIFCSFMYTKLSLPKLKRWL